MADKYNVFISWSGERSEKVAKALYDWLPNVLQTVNPWMSKEDIEKGTRALEEIGKAVESMSVGVVCLTPENADKPWIHFEAGALSKTMGERTRVCTYLFGGLRGEQVKLPLGIFQATRAEDKEETRKMVLAVSRALGGVVGDDRVGSWFEREWPALEGKLAAIPAKVAVAHQVDDKKMLAQMLELAQAAANNNAKLREELRGVREVVDRVAGAGAPLSAFSGIGAPSRFPVLGEMARGNLSSFAPEGATVIHGVGGPIQSAGGLRVTGLAPGAPVAAAPTLQETEEMLARVRAELGEINRMRAALAAENKPNDGKK